MAGKKTGRNILAEMVIPEIPRLFGMIDRNPYSETYGCIDRNFWHYKIVDFPSGMHQVGALLLAFVYCNDFPGNIYYKKERIKELCIAAMRFMEKSSHRDGSADEFYPYERALGATELSLYCATEAYLLLKHRDEGLKKFFRKRAGWIIENDEPGLMANHHAGAALALLNVYLVCKDKKYLEAGREKIKQVISLQSPEGWFREYEGCDPGYLTVTIDFLAKYYEKTREQILIAPMEKAIVFASYFIHPDGSFGGEYGSRNTYHFVPHGFELMAGRLPQAAYINDLWLQGVANRKHEHMNDDRYFMYDAANRLQAYVDYCGNRKEYGVRGNFKKYFSDAKIFVAKWGGHYLVSSLAKAGVFKLFKGKKLVASDCGLAGRLGNKTAITQLIDNYEIKVSRDMKHLEVSGSFNFVRDELPSPLKFMLFRLGLLTVGRAAWGGRFIKKHLTKKLILGKSRAPARFRRIFDIGNALKVTDEIQLNGHQNVTSLYIPTDLAAIHVPGSRYYQESVLHEWTDLGGYLNELNKNRRVTIRRELK